MDDLDCLKLPDSVIETSCKFLVGEITASKSAFSKGLSYPGPWTIVIMVEIKEMKTKIDISVDLLCPSTISDNEISQGYPNSSER